MPYFNGTGPTGSGPGTGRGRGKCRTGMPDSYALRRLSGRRYGWLSGLVVSIVTMVVRDAMNPSGLLRGSFLRLLRNRQSESIPSSCRDAQVTVEGNHQVTIRNEVNNPR